MCLLRHLVIVASVTFIIVLLKLEFCLGFSARDCNLSSSRRAIVASSSALGLSSPAEEVDEQASSKKLKTSYRYATLSDLPAIAKLLYSVFDDNEEDDNLDSKGDMEATAACNDENSEIDKSTNDSNTFLWDSLEEKKTNDESSSHVMRSPKEQLEFIEQQLERRMTDAKKEGSYPHSFLVATIPSSSSKIPDDESLSTTITSSIDIDSNVQPEQQQQQIIGFLEMGTLPSPVGKAVELPFIGNLAVANKMRRQKVGSTLIRLAIEIGRKWIKLPYIGTNTAAAAAAGSIGSTLLGKWFSPSSSSSASSPAVTPPFLFLSVECDNYDALLFYKRLNFEEVKLGTNGKVYLARELE
uniref:N-acetyltransferase domain-containing protein n=1 Tax=Ditylum brightwellii TaxID=49249 RepID=A0A7S1VZE1_9STRA|mmetsp:Transcript_11114/g.16540  ORF Transcript_11114/g.16540 Transcript_11114/m.16540 type:complete len:355 (+) Transcript_11114:115-1179(+)